MPIIGFDADQDCSHVAHLAATKGVKFIGRYLKNLSVAEVKVLSAAGLKIVSIAESTARRALDGYEAGLEDGANAQTKASTFSQPQGSAICATVDFDPVVNEEIEVLEYLRGFKEGAPEAKLMVYANGSICQQALDKGYADYTFVAGGNGMRGTRAFKASGKATIVQDVGDAANLELGIDIDSDTALVEDYGGWSI